jgi:hypothetical protein
MASTKMEKPSLHPLKTPKTATFPSELQCKSPFPSLNVIIKQEEGLKTPITPPLAYTEFLKALTPVLTSPMSAGVISEKSSGKSTPTSQPSSAATSCYCACDGRKSPNSGVPPSPFIQPRSAKTPTGLRRLRIPTSSPLYSPIDSPHSASARSPYSPSDWSLDAGVRYFDRPRSGVVRPVSVRQVVTRTVTYKRTDLDPAPKGKRRKTMED